MKYICFICCFFTLSIISVSAQEKVDIKEKLFPFESKNGKWGYLDTKTRKIVIEPKYDYAYPFSNEIAIVSIGPQLPRFYYHDGYNPARYEKVELANDHFIIAKEGKYGLLDKKGKEIFPCKFDDLDFQSPNFLFAKFNNDEFYVDVNGVEYTSQ